MYHRDQVTYGLRTPSVSCYSAVNSISTMSLVTSQSLTLQAHSIRHRLVALLENIPDDSGEILKQWKEEFASQLVSPFPSLTEVAYDYG
jgi:hypothetical protein